MPPVTNTVGLKSLDLLGAWVLPVVSLPAGTPYHLWYKLILQLVLYLSHIDAFLLHFFKWYMSHHYKQLMNVVIVYLQSASTSGPLPSLLTLVSSLCVVGALSPLVRHAI